MTLLYVMCYHINEEKNNTMNYIEKDMIQYDRGGLKRVKDLSKIKHYQCGNFGVYILVDFSKEYKYSLLFGDVITHEFKTLEALENWNSDCNSFIVAINISIAISKIKGERFYE